MTRLIWRDEEFISIKIATNGELTIHTPGGVSLDQGMGVPNGRRDKWVDVPKCTIYGWVSRNRNRESQPFRQLFLGNNSAR